MAYQKHYLGKNCFFFCSVLMYCSLFKMLKYCFSFADRDGSFRFDKLPPLSRTGNSVGRLVLISLRYIVILYILYNVVYKQSTVWVLGTNLIEIFLLDHSIFFLLFLFSFFHYFKTVYTSSENFIYYVVIIWNNK